MKVTCKTNKTSESFSLDTASRLKRHISIGEDELEIEIGKEYVVYGIELWDNCPWLYICTEPYDEYPKPFALDFFEISDKKLSSHWILKSKETHNKKNKTQFVFQEWAENDNFYENLVNEDQTCITIFNRYKKLLDTE